MKIIGIKDVKFKGSDGQTIEGFNVFYSEPIVKNGIGFSTDKFFISEKRRKSLQVNIEIGDEIEILYNRFGKLTDVVIKDTVE